MKKITLEHFPGEETGIIRILIKRPDQENEIQLSLDLGFQDDH
ncbi:hypothetical protein [Priestia koreensis]|nr:hypothetical protein [Priestia koreensis]